MRGWGWGGAGGPVELGAANVNGAAVLQIVPKYLICVTTFNPHSSLVLE